MARSVTISEAIFVRIQLTTYSEKAWYAGGGGKTDLSAPTGRAINYDEKTDTCDPFTKQFFDPLIGPIMTEVVKLDWRYGFNVNNPLLDTNAEVNAKRLILSEVVLYWISRYLGPGAWWRDASSSDRLNHTLIKAWLLQGEAGEFMRGDLLEMDPNPAQMMARDKNSHFDDGYTALKFAKYTYFFNPSRGSDFDQSDWTKWLTPPTTDAIDLIESSGMRGANDPTDWWGYNEVACDKRPDYDRAIQTQPSSVYQFAFYAGRQAHDPNKKDFYLGTAEQHAAANGSIVQEQCP